MAYDLLIKNGRIVDGSGMPAFHGDVAVEDGKIAEIGKLSGAAGQTVDVGGQVIAPGFIDNHCHYDAQVTWDPLCSFSCDHGATSVIIGNCSLALAPVRRGQEKRRGRGRLQILLAQQLSDFRVRPEDAGALAALEARLGLAHDAGEQRRTQNQDGGL